MRVSDIIFCLKATNSKETGVNADRIVNVLNPDYIPGLFTFSIIVMVLGYDVTQTHLLSLKLSSPSDEQVVVLETTVPSMDGEPSNLPKEYQGITFAIDCNNTNLKSSGLYKLIVSIDGSILGEKEIFVKGKNE